MKILSKSPSKISGCFLAVALSAQASGAATCESLINAPQLPNGKVTAAEHISGGFFQLPPFCRVAATLKPSPHSNINMEVWMPNDATKANRGWNGKYLGTGNGGFGSAIVYSALIDGLKRGYAVANTDMGTSDPEDFLEGKSGSALIATPKKWLDYSFRATSEMTKTAKLVIGAFYERPPAQSYFVGCSQGGGQALMQAQRFPDDYDGILAGNPANSRRVIFGILGAYQATWLNDNAGLLTLDKLRLLKEKILQTCRGPTPDAGHASDDFISDPQACRFDPRTLQCRLPMRRTGCLTSAQAEAAFKMYDGPRVKDDPNRRSIYPGWPFGSEAVPSNWASFEGVIWVENVPQRPFASIVFNTHFRSIFGDAWKWTEFEFTTQNLDKFDNGCVTTDPEVCGLTKMGEATNPELNKFKAPKLPTRPHGGKLIMYHGQADAVVPPQVSIDYYKSVVEKQGSEAETLKFARLFLAPGMAHCTGGPGPNSFNTPNPLDLPAEKHDLLSALDKWVTTGEAPPSVVATKLFVDANPMSGVAMSRPLCPYPKMARFKGGNPHDDRSFECR